MIECKNKLLRLASLLIITLFVFVSTGVFAECDSGTEDHALRDRSWIKNDNTIYFETEGKIYETHFNSEKLALLADHGFDYIADFQLSPNVQYIFYEGFLANQGFSSYLYDIKHKTDYKLPISYDPPIMPHFEFSPNSKKAVWTDIDPKLGSHKFVIMDLEDHTLETVDYPLDPKTMHDYRSTDAKWSLVGNHVYLGTIAYPTGAYYKYDIKSHTITQIDGRYHPMHDYRDFADYGLHFIEIGHELPYYKPPCLQWQCSDQGKAMDGEGIAIDKEFNLLLTTPEGKKVLIDKGEYNQCEGVTIRVLSWLEKGKYLIYQVHGTTYIFGVEENRKSILSIGSEFGWDDNENRKVIEAF